MSKKRKTNKLSRRSLLEGLGMTTLLGGLAHPFQSYLTSSASAQTAPPKKLLVVFLEGAWDSALATDPVVGSKSSSSTYASEYGNYSTTQISGKDLIVGKGLENVAPAMANVSTAFVNGIHVEVTAHQLAANFVLSGVNSLSRSREYPALPALLGEAKATFPSHLLMGGRIPLGSTGSSSPPLFAQNYSAIQMMLRGPYVEWIPAGQIDRAHSLISQLDTLHRGSLGTSGQTKFDNWQNAQSGISGLYQKNFSQQMTLTDSIKSDYNIANEWDDSALLAGAFLSLKSGLSRFTTVVQRGYDTHTSHFASHLPLLNDFSTRLNTLLNGLRATPDPDNAGMSLIETTTVLVTSEFVRTPHLNLNGGTDHWQSGSAILMGRGVTDNRIVGATDDDANPLGWTGSSSTTRDSSTEILPGDLIATILESFDEEEVANTISSKRLSNLISKG